jgi:hypothetical protein
MRKDKMIPSLNTANKTINVTNNIATKASPPNKDTSKDVSKDTSSKDSVLKSTLNTFKDAFKDTLTASKDTSSKDVSKDTSNVFNKFFKNVSKEKEIANVAQNVFTISKDKNVLSKEKEIIKDIVESVSTNATEEMFKETNAFKAIDKTRGILPNNEIPSKLENTSALDKALSYIDKTSSLKTETLQSKELNQLASSSIDNLNVNKLLTIDKQQIDREKENKFLSFSNKEKEKDTKVTNDFLSKNTTLPESSINMTANSPVNNTAGSTVNNNTINPSLNNNPKFLQELKQSLQLLVEETKKQNTALNQIARKDSNVYIDSTKAGTANRIGATEIG